MLLYNKHDPVILMIKIGQEREDKSTKKNFKKIHNSWHFKIEIKYVLYCCTTMLHVQAKCIAVEMWGYEKSIDAVGEPVSDGQLPLVLFHFTYYI